MNAKLGLSDVAASDAALTEDLMKLMAQDAVDFTIFWRRLSHTVSGTLEPVRDLFLQREAFDAWIVRWQQRLQDQPGFDATTTQTHMLRTNPHVVLRNHLGELAIRRAKAGDFTELARLQNALEHPYEELPGHDDLAGFPPEWAGQIEINCSS
jgi:serine/tyrosine/threonine adenylyltransferase